MENQKRNVSIKVCTVQKDEDGKSNISADYKGTLYFKQGVCYVFYTEYTEEGEESAKCRIKSAPGFVEIKREGAYSSRLCFETGKPYKTVYNTPYGHMPVEIKTKKAISALDINGGKIMLEYNMSLAGKEFDNSVVVYVRLLS